MKHIERIIPPPVAPGMVGDGFRVFNYIPGGGNIPGTEVPQERISPFLLLDFNAEIDFGPSERVRGVGVHPHKGFETITIAYKGSVAHHDSAGNSGVVGPGDVQWMTAGSGILHKEYHEEEFSRKGGPFEMVQLWVNLPRKDKSAPPHYQTITRAQMGKVAVPGGEVNVIAGNFDGVRGPAATYTPIHLFDIRLGAAGQAKTSLPASFNTAALVVKGSAEINGQVAAQHSLVLFANEGEDISITALEETVILLLSGEPINEPIVAYGPFVMNTQAEVIESIREAQSGKYGVLE